MIFHSPILALLLASFVSVVTLGWAALFALRVVSNWNINSGSERQIEMEKRTYLVVTALKFVLVLELLSLILFVINADQMSVLFTGAMCAVGSLNMNGYGTPALLLKMAVFFGAAIWLILNRVDEAGRDYPLTKHKYAVLIVLAPLVVAAAITQFLYFYNLKADVITSCCSRLFTPEADGVEAEMSSMAPQQALWLLFGGFAVLVAFAGWFWKRQAGRWLFAPVSIAFFAIALVAVISVISSYIYEHPHHHCPFCILKPEYGYIGFALYLPLFTGAAFGMAGGLLAVFQEPSSLAGRYPRMVARTITISACFFGIFLLVASYAILHSHLILFG